MKERLRASRRGSLPVLAVIAALAVLTALLSIYALRQTRVAGEGESPGPAPTWSNEFAPHASPSSTGSPAAIDSAAVVAPNLLSFADALVGVRGFRGSCGTTTPTLERTPDGGVTWMPLSFGTLSVREILAVSAVSETQVDLVARVGDDCATTVVTSYTSGDFWQSYPDRLTEFTYVDPADPTVIYSEGSQTPSPCAAPLDATRLSESALAVLCEGAVFVAPPGFSFVTVGVTAPLAMSAGQDGATLVMASGETGSCTGIQVAQVAVASAEAPTVQACIDENSLGSLSLATAGTSAWIWAGSTIFYSMDSGITWVPLAP